MAREETSELIEKDGMIFERVTYKESGEYEVALDYDALEAEAAQYQVIADNAMEKVKNLKDKAGKAKELKEKSKNKDKE